MENNKKQTVKPTGVGPEEDRIPTGRPNLDEIKRRNAEEEKQDRKSSYSVKGIIALLIFLIIVLMYFFT